MTDSPWIEWGGGKCPVPLGTLVDVHYRDGGIRANQQALIQDGAWRNAEARFWEHYGDRHHSDIVAFRLVNPEPQP